MRVQSLYLDTSALGGYFDAAWADDTRHLWQQRGKAQWRFLSSGLVAQEIAGAPAEVRELFESTFDRNKDLLPVTEEMADLAEEYLKAKVVSPNFADDALHVAICSVHQVDHLVSWNFKHLVSVRRAAGFNAVNLLHGYRPVSIVSPKELIYDLDDE